MKASVPAGTVFALLLLATMACSNNNGDIDDEDSDDFREDVITCEDAVAKLSRCCPGFDPAPVLCDYYWHHVRNTGCNSTSESYDSKKPALKIGEARCIEAMKCEDLPTSGVCKRAAAAREETYSSSSSVEDTTAIDTAVGSSSTLDASPVRTEAVCQ